MKPLVVDTTVWIEWLQGRRRDLMDRCRPRTLFMAAPVEMELQAGIHSAKNQRILDALMEPFVRHGRILLPRREEYKRAGQLLAESGLAAARNATDALICVCARSIGAEVWTLDTKDFLPLGRLLHLEVGPE